MGSEEVGEGLGEGSCISASLDRPAQLVWVRNYQGSAVDLLTKESNLVNPEMLLKSLPGLSLAVESVRKFEQFIESGIMPLYGNWKAVIGSYHC